MYLYKKIQLKELAKLFEWKLAKILLGYHGKNLINGICQYGGYKAVVGKIVSHCNRVWLMCLTWL